MVRTIFLHSLWSHHNQHVQAIWIPMWKRLPSPLKLP
jgi:hypothetical protein